MAISPPSDILLDVANAADPASVRAATARLATLAADPTAKAGDFAKALAAARRDGTASSAGVTGLGGAAHGGSTLASSSSSVAARAAPLKRDTYQKFEAVLLTNFVESMLPKDDELYGDKQSAGIYRSMLAEQFANQISRAGGIGIAKAVEHAHPSSASLAPHAAHVTAPIKDQTT